MGGNRSNNFDIIRKYDITYLGYDELYGEEQREKYEVTFSKIKPEGRVADIGCGTGLLIDYLTKIGFFESIKNYVCVDLSIKMLTSAAKKNPSCHKCAFILGNAERLPFKDKQFDYVFSFSMINLLNEPSKGVAELMRIGKKRIVSIVKKLKHVGIAGKLLGETEKDLILMI
ncbi:MAG: class I SAM-dependent methyltransferase [Caldisphaeraceae archaeon]|nr:class I SAM-dependent methyltransferase [Caldisphaeraceae archaeon]MEB3692228.1 class I SAM-dependent methyltransferase [Caldisphaeraceae archaeon]MEB3797785.1 class I SAM-dependent methyltransferase [Caldisphaeraceae archaeon]